MTKEIFKMVKKEISGRNAKNLAERIHIIDRVSGFKNFHRSANLCCEEMKKAGLKDVKIMQFKADGVTTYGDHIIPQAWDAEEAELHLIEPEESAKPLASYREESNHLFMYSAPTAKEGVVSEVIWIKGNKLDDYKKVNLKGKIVFTSHHPGRLWRYTEKAGAVGIICDYGKDTEHHGAVHWQNYCFVPKNTKGLFGFSITQEKGTLLKNLFSEGKKVKVSARVKAKSYNGTADLITGIIPGTTRRDEEIWIFAHLYEVGAWDNASGSASVIEVGRALNKLIRDKILPPPKRTIRFMSGWECYGLICYLMKNFKNIDAFIAGITLDGVGIDPFQHKVPLGIYGTPESNPAYTDFLLERIAEETLSSRNGVNMCKKFPYIAGDTGPADPCFNIPFAYLLRHTKDFWHESNDTIEKLSSETLADDGAIATTYLYFLASASYQESLWLAYLVCSASQREINSQIVKKTEEIINSLKEEKDGWKVREKLDSLKERVNYFIRRESQRLNSLSKLLTEKERKRIKSVFHSINKKISRYANEMLENSQSTILSFAHDLKLSVPQYLYKELTPQEKLAKSLIPKRLVKGVLTLETLPEEVKYTCKWGPGYQVLVSPILWTDGKRDLLKIAHLVEQEKGSVDLSDLTGCYKFLEKHGYIRIKRHKVVEISRGQIKNALQKLGVKTKSVVFVHSSLKSMGHVIGGPDAVIDALLEVVGESGTIVMPTFSYNYCRSSSAPFNPETTPSAVGRVTEVFRLRKNAVRSKQSSHSVAAIGPKARYITEGHENLTPYSKEGPFGKLVELDSYILFLGCGMTPNSMLHAVEDWMNMPYLMVAESPVLGKDGKVEIVKIGKAPYDHRDFYKPSSKVEKYLRRIGIVKHSTLGKAKVQLVKAKELVEEVMKQMKKEPDLLLCDAPDCKFCSNWKRKCG